MKKPLIPILILFVASVAFLWFGMYTPFYASSKETRIFHVLKGQGSREIAYNLEQEKLIRWSSLFRVYVLTIAASHRLKAGNYELSSNLSMQQIAKKLIEGDVLRERITVVEGWSVKDIAKALETKGLGSSLAFTEAYLHLEGYLFPDTYDINPAESLEELVTKMQDNFAKKTVGLEQHVKESKKSLQDIVIMASLLEKEVQSLEDKKLVSDILWRRLKAGIALQVDVAPDTYKYRGLPQGPIGNPGLDSLKAALEPQKNFYWYYLSKPTGETVFSKTLEEHNLAKAQYLK